MKRVVIVGAGFGGLRGASAGAGGASLSATATGASDNPPPPDQVRLPAECEIVG